MKKLVAMLVVAALASPAMATMYADATGDLHDGTGGGTDFSGFTHLDIASVEITDNALDTIQIDISLVGDIDVTDWGKYMVIIDSIAGGDVAGNGWGRPISMTSGADYWIGSWADSGNGAETYHYDGAGWVMDNATYAPPSDISISKSGVTATLVTSFASLGLSPGDTFAFDVFSSGGGGGDGAVDALGNASPQILDWGDSSSAVLPANTYTVTPEPATLALLAMGGLAVARRRR